MLQIESMRDRSDAVPAFNDTPVGGPYLWNALGFTRPTGDPLDKMGSTERNDSLLEMGKGQRVDVDGIYLNAEWDLGGHTAFFVAGKRDQKEHLPNTYTGAAPVNTVTNQPLSLFDATRDTDRETTQFEARLASNSDGPLNYVIGAFQQTNDAKFCVVQVLGFIDLALPFASLGLPAQFNNNTPQVLCNQQDSDSLAGYVDATYDLTDKLSIGGGFRYTRDERSWAGRTQVGFGGDDAREPEDGERGIVGVDREADAGGGGSGGDGGEEEPEVLAELGGVDGGVAGEQRAEAIEGEAEAHAGDEVEGLLDERVAARGVEGFPVIFCGGADGGRVVGRGAGAG
jgi:outer membrane receptor protein involved in Fe transport